MQGSFLLDPMIEMRLEILWGRKFQIWVPGQAINEMSNQNAILKPTARLDSRKTYVVDRCGVL